MSVAVICCRMLENELKKIYKEENITAPIFWLDAGLHNAPEELHTELQILLDSLSDDITRVILLYSLCGQAVLGLKTRDFELIMPRTDDCIALLLNGNANKIKNNGTFFLTDRWIEDEKSVMNEYKYALEKYGPNRCEKIFKRQFAHYSVLGLLDTGCYDVNALMERTASISNTLELKQKIIHTDCAMLRKLIQLAEADAGTLPDFSTDDYIFIEKNSEITREMFSRM